MLQSWKMPLNHDRAITFTGSYHRIQLSWYQQFSCYINLFKIFLLWKFFPMKHLLEYSWAFGGTSHIFPFAFFYIFHVRLLMSAFSLFQTIHEKYVWIFFSPSSAKKSIMKYLFRWILLRWQLKMSFWL